MGMALDQLFVRVADASASSDRDSGCVAQVAQACGVALEQNGDSTDATITGFVDTRQQLAVACLLHWKLKHATDNGAGPPVVSVSDTAMDTCFSLAELLGCESKVLEDGDVRVLDAVSFVSEVLVEQEQEQKQEQEQEVGEEEDEEGKAKKDTNKVQIVDSRSEKAFLGIASAQEVSGHLTGAHNVPFASIFMPSSTNAGEDDDKDKAEEAEKAKEESASNSKDDAFLLDEKEMHDVFEVAGIDFEKPAVVVGGDPAEAAAVATALLLAGHHASISFCLQPLTDPWVASFPASFTTDIFEKDQLFYAEDGGKFDLSPAADANAKQLDKEVAEELQREYKEHLDGKKKSKKHSEEEEEEQKEDIVWVKDGRRFFDMPSPVSKAVFLDSSRAIFRVVSFVLAPFGFPVALREKRTLEEVKTQCGSLFQDVIEVCSDLIYQQKALNEGAMAMSVHKWVEEKRDVDCTEQVKAINDIWKVLYSPPAVVEVPDLSEDRVVEIATQLDEKLRETLVKRTPWAFDVVEEDEDSDVEKEAQEDTEKDTVVDAEKKEGADKEAGMGEDGDDSKLKETESAENEDGEATAKKRLAPTDKLAKNWTYMYPNVVHTLGFLPQELGSSHKKLSTLQLKSFIQAVAEVSWDVVGSEDNQLSEVEFQALCETLSAEKRSLVEERGRETQQSLYVLKHFLTRSLEHDDKLVESLAAVREAVQDGDRRLRSGRHQVALAAYAKAFNYLPLFHKDLENAVVGRAKCFLELKELSRAKTEAQIALLLNPYSAGAYECLGRVEEGSEHPDEAMQHFVTAFILDGSRSPEHAEAIDRMSRHVGRRVAKTLFADMEKVHELPSAWLVESYFESFEHDADATARVPWDIEKKESVEQGELDALTLLHRAVHYKRKKDFAAMQRDIWTLVDKDMEAEGLTVEQRALALNLQASLLYVVGDVHAAVEVITESLALLPTCVNSLVKKGGFLSEIGERDQATSCFAEAMELDPNDADVHLHMGQMELLDGEYYRAVQCLRRCISRSDALPVTHVSYGMALYKSGSTYQAKDVFKEASAKFPECAEVHLFHGEVLADQGNYADAMRHFLTAWELSPQCPLPFLNAGRVYVGTNDPQRAIAHFQQALDVDPRCSSAHLDIAQVLFAQGRTREAFEHFEVAASCCRFLPEVEEVCACQEMAKMQLKVTEILGVELRHIMRAK